MTERCRRGHPWTASNTIIRTDGRRMCRRCAALRARKYYRHERHDGWACLDCTPRRPCASHEATEPRA